jgi:hypothetical protein
VIAHAQFAAADRFGSVSGAFSFCLFTICCGTLSAHEVIYDVKKSRGFTTAPGEIKWDRFALQICNFWERFNRRSLPALGLPAREICSAD